MSISFGASKSKEKSSSTGSFDRTDAPIVPDWISSGVQGLAGQITDFFSGADPSSLVAGADPLQTQAAAGASALSPRSWVYDESADTIRNVTNAAAPQMQSASLLDGLDNYMSPYTGQVVDAALADFDFGAGQTRAQQALDLAGAGAFGGSGAALTRSATEDALARARGATSATLRDQGFQVGANLSNQDAGRRQQTSATNAQLEADNRNRQLAGAGQLVSQASQLGADERATVGTQAGMGEVMRDITQDQVGAPVDFLAQQLALYTGLPLEMFVGMNSKGTEKTSGKSSGTAFGISGKYGG